MWFANWPFLWIKKCRDIRNKTPTSASKRVAILAALNIAEELFRVRGNCAELAQRVDELVELIDKKCQLQGKEVGENRPLPLGYQAK